jgi:hypothetical protein
MITSTTASGIKHQTGAHRVVVAPMIMLSWHMDQEPGHRTPPEEASSPGDLPDLATARPS